MGEKPWALIELPPEGNPGTLELPFSSLDYPDSVVIFNLVLALGGFCQICKIKIDSLYVIDN